MFSEIYLKPNKVSDENLSCQMPSLLCLSKCVTPLHMILREKKDYKCWILLLENNKKDLFLIFSYPKNVDCKSLRSLKKQERKYDHKELK